MLSSQLVGAWRLNSDAQEGIAVFADKYYSAIIVDKNRRKVAPASIGQNEMLEAYQTMSAQGGTYTLEGSTIRLNRELSRGLDAQGEPLLAELSLNGDQLIGKEISSGGKQSPVVMTWTKVK